LFFPRPVDVAEAIPELLPLLPAKWQHKWQQVRDNQFRLSRQLRESAREGSRTLTPCGGGT
jgi:hypothetical protein